MEARALTLRLPLRDPFRIARPGDAHAVSTVLVELDLDGIAGLGEGFPIRYRGETSESVTSRVQELAPVLTSIGGPPADRTAALAWLENVSSLMADESAGNAARCALDIALHDVVGRRLGMSVEELLDVPETIPPTDFSLGIDDPAVVVERASRASHFPALKIKVGGPTDLKTLHGVRSVYDGPLRIDANTGWQRATALGMLEEVLSLGIELIEQPFAADDIDSMAWLQQLCPVPIVADESAVVIGDLERLAGKVRGVNIKLAKCGGITPARAMITRARELGMLTMLGCMEETSIGIRAAAAIAGQVDWVDLDGCLLLDADPVTGLVLGEDCRWVPPKAPGLGLQFSPIAGVAPAV